MGYADFPPDDVIDDINQEYNLPTIDQDWHELETWMVPHAMYWGDSKFPTWRVWYTTYGEHSYLIRQGLAL